jgi:hypothetical protein
VLAFEFVQRKFFSFFALAKPDEQKGKDWLIEVSLQLRFTEVITHISDDCK